MTDVPELCGHEHYRHDDAHPLRCNRAVDPQPDGRRHRGDHTYRSPHFGWSWPNPLPRTSRQQGKAASCEGY